MARRTGAHALTGARADPETRCVTVCPLTLMPRQEERATLVMINTLPVTDDVKQHLKHNYYQMVEARQNYEQMAYRGHRLLIEV